MEKGLLNSDKELLLKDLCARLPYGLKVSYYDLDEEILKCDTLEGVERGFVTVDGFQWEITDIKPYLFPLSSMTEEQKVEFDKMSELDVEYTIKQIKNNSPIWTSGLNRFNWFLKNHFDVYELIPMGLAIDATGLNIY